MEIRTKDFELNGNKYHFRNNMRAMIEMERLTDKVEVKGGLEESMLMLYCGTQAGMKYEKQEFNIEFEDFIDMVDANFDILSQIFKGQYDILEEAVELSKKK